MATDSPQFGPRGEDRSHAPGVRQPPPLHLVLYCLAILSILALGGLLYLDTRVNEFYAHSVAGTRMWSDRQESYAQLGRLATDLVEPDVASPDGIDSTPDTERVRMAATAFHVEIERALLEANQNTVGALRTALLDR